LSAFALQRIENFFDLVTHTALPKIAGAVRFLYMVVLYMAPVIRKTLSAGTPPRGGVF
jgi:hypothetical protein